MGITYFALGMLSMVALIFVGVIVWGLFKVGKLERQIGVIKEDIKSDYDIIQRQMGSHKRDLQDFHLEITNKFDKMEQYEIKRFDELLRIINDRHNLSIKYTDKRIDKSLNQKEVL